MSGPANLARKLLHTPPWIVHVHDHRSAVSTDEPLMIQPSYVVVIVIDIVVHFVIVVVVVTFTIIIVFVIMVEKYAQTTTLSKGSSL